MEAEVRYWWALDQILRAKRQQGNIKKPLGKKSLTMKGAKISIL